MPQRIINNNQITLKKKSYYTSCVKKWKRNASYTKWAIQWSLSGRKTHHFELPAGVTHVAKCLK